jgi:hypothetical protein
VSPLQGVPFIDPLRRVPFREPVQCVPFSWSPAGFPLGGSLHRKTRWSPAGEPIECPLQWFRLSDPITGSPKWGPHQAAPIRWSPPGNFLHWVPSRGFPPRVSYRGSSLWDLHHQVQSRGSPQCVPFSSSPTLVPFRRSNHVATTCGMLQGFSSGVLLIGPFQWFSGFPFIGPVQGVPITGSASVDPFRGDNFRGSLSGVLFRGSLSSGPLPVVPRRWYLSLVLFRGSRSGVPLPQRRVPFEVSPSWVLCRVHFR